MRYKIGLLFLINAFLSSTFVLSAEINVDIRINGILDAQSETIPYLLSITDCSGMTAVEIVAGATIQNLLPTEGERLEKTAKGCVFKFNGEGNGRLDPEVTLHLKDAAEIKHSENFSYENNLPDLEFESVSFSEQDQQQFLNVLVNVKDDVDMRFVAFNVMGIRASDLRAVGGVLELAKEKAFVTTEGYVNVYPVMNGQGQYVLSLPINAALNAEEIAHNGMVMLNMQAVDASNNQTSLSQIKFTGDDVVEAVSDLQVNPQQIIFTHLLETATIIPSVQFQFRGLTALPGLGNDVSYQSSHPDLVVVTAGGLVYPLQETTEPVVISVSYPGVETVEISVKVDLSKQLSHLKMDNLNVNGFYVLERLNQRFNAPILYGVFDDGSRMQLGDQLAVNYQISEVAAAVLKLDSRGRMTANGIIPEQAPVQLSVSLASQPNVKLDIPVVAYDGLPEIVLNVEPFARVGGLLTLSAVAVDDVGIREVHFLIDDNVVGVVKGSPYQLSVILDEQMANRKLVLKALVFDSAGQQNISALKTLIVKPKNQTTAPEMLFDGPKELQRFVENTTFRMQVSYRLGSKSSREDYNERSGVSHIDFFMDGKKIGTSYFPLIEVREEPSAKGPIKVDYEVWRLSSKTPDVSTDEANLGVMAIVYAGVEKSYSKLIQVIKNSPPVARITKPTEGQTLTNGQAYDVEVEIIDDTLDMGSKLELLINDEVIDKAFFEDKETQFEERMGARGENYKFPIIISNEALGNTLNIQVRLVDFHNIMTLSEAVKVPVKSDRPPQVSLTHPQQGDHLISGLSVELRAEATDDIKVKEVLFYVNDQLVGSDQDAPFILAYETLKGIEQEQPLTIAVVAEDEKGNQSDKVSVKVTLGKDEEPPVVNISSPVMTMTEGGDNLAEVVEDSELVFKATGYDNVKTKQLILSGIKKEGLQYLLTGNEADVITEPDFIPQQIEGTLGIFSAFKLIKVPFFKHQDDIEYDRYPVKVIAIDDTGNQSEDELIIAVRADQDPVVVAATAEKSAYYPKDWIKLDVLTRDDRAVVGIEVNFYLDDQITPAVSQIHDASTGFLPAKNKPDFFELDLAALSLSNASHQIRVEIIATDNRGHRSNDHAEIYTKQLTVKADHNPPLLGVFQPVPGSLVYSGDKIKFKWKVLDESQVDSVVFTDGDHEISRNSGFERHTTTEKSFDFTIPIDIEDLIIKVSVKDIFGNEKVTEWQYPVIQDSPPQISFRQPAAGSRLVEGEAFTMNALVTDNRKVAAIQFFIEKNGQTLFEKQAEVHKDQTKDQYYSALMRVPTRPEDNQTELKIGIRATDDHGLVAEKLLELIIVDDLEPPMLLLAKPDGNFSLKPGENLKISGKGDDNFYIDRIHPVVILPSGEEQRLEWAVLSRDDRVESITAPNPLSFGEFIVSRRFYTDFEGFVKLPESLYRAEDIQYQLFFRTQDLGVNHFETPKLKMMLLGDHDAPVVTVKKPTTTLIDRQNVNFNIEITDNVAVNSYQVFLLDGAETILLEKDSINEPSTKIITRDGLILDLAQYVPIPEQGRTITLKIQATDTTGNMTEQLHAMKILPNAPPQLTMTRELPEKAVVKGSVMSGAIKIEDDYVGLNDDKLAYFPLYTTLQGMGVGGSRAPTGLTQHEEPLPNMLASMNKPAIQFKYPEGDKQPFRFLIEDETYLSAKNGLLVVNPQLFYRRGFWRLDFGSEIQVAYHLEIYNSSACPIKKELKTITAAEGINSEILHDVYFAMITLELKDLNGNVLESPIQKLLYYNRNFSQTSQYVRTYAGLNSSNHAGNLVVVLNDETGNETNSAYLATGRNRIYGQGEETQFLDEDQVFTYIPL